MKNKSKKRKQSENNSKNSIKNKSIDSDKKIGNNNSNDVWKKIALFMIIFFPYALYLFLFKTNISRYIKGLVIIFSGLLLFIVVDVVYYPNRVHDEVIYDNIQKMKSDDVINIGTVYNLEKRNSFKYKGEEFIAYNLYDEYNMYYGIFKVEDYNKEYTLEYLYSLSGSPKLIMDNKFQEFNSIHPIVFTMILSDSYLSAYNKITEIEEIKIKDLFENNKFQSVWIDNKKVIFEFNDFGIVEYKSEFGDIEYHSELNPLLGTSFKSVNKVLTRNFKDNYKVVGFSYFNITPTFNVIVGNKKYIVQYYYGEGASLQSIEEEDKYFEFLKEKYEISNKLN